MQGLRHYRYAMALLLMLAFASRALLPQGFMWGQSDDRFVIAICDADSTLVAPALDPRTGAVLTAEDSADHAAADLDERCPFEGIPSLALSNNPDALPSLWSLYGTQPSVLRQHHAQFTTRPPLPARGPPTA
ncbi:hypothetical protein [Algiphilus sp.]|uniref:hypothetical protein n=1 Tax=Algiphilus sp. TaxID=1872431 RepID=UPI002A62B609|nr:hypothetical protein [Pseudomonadota bacterium]